MTGSQEAINKLVNELSLFMSGNWAFLRGYEKGRGKDFISMVQCWYEETWQPDHVRLWSVYDDVC